MWASFQNIYIYILNPHVDRVVDVNTLIVTETNGRHFAADIFKHIFLSENVWISINISLKIIPGDPINNMPALVQIMAWHQKGDEPLSEPKLPRLPTHIHVRFSSPQWVK